MEDVDTDIEKEREQLLRIPALGASRDNSPSRRSRSPGRRGRSSSPSRRGTSQSPVRSAWSVASSPMSGLGRLLSPFGSRIGKFNEQEKSISKSSGPLLFQNPDGTMVEALPPGYKEKERKRPTRIGFTSYGVLWGELEADQLDTELLLQYQRHEKLFVCMIGFQFLIEALSIYFFIAQRERHEEELKIIYGNHHHSSGSRFWISLIGQILFALGYYFTAWAAIAYQKNAYRWFAVFCMGGIMEQILLTYLNKFNLITFFVRLLIYIYSKFMKALQQNCQLIRDHIRDNPTNP